MRRDVDPHEYETRRDRDDVHTWLSHTTHRAVDEESAQDDHAQQNRTGRPHHLQQIISFMKSRVAGLVRAVRASIVRYSRMPPETCK